MQTKNSLGGILRLSKSRIEEKQFCEDCEPKLRETLKGNPELVLVTPGMAVGSAFTHGQIAGLKESGIIESDIKYIMPVSGSTGSGIYWVSGQFDIGTFIWLNGLADNKIFLETTSHTRYIIRLNAKRIGGILQGKSREDFLKDNSILHIRELIRLFQNNEVKDGNICGVKFDFDAFMASENCAIIPLRKVKTHECIYFSNHTIEGAETIRNEEELWLVVEATKTIPLVAGGPIEIRGEKYYDGSYGDPLQLGIRSPVDGIGLESINKVISEDGENIRKGILPIVLFPGNIFDGNSQIIRKLKKHLLNLLVLSKIGDLIDISAKIYSPKYLEWLRQLALDGKIVLIYNSGEKINPLDNSKGSIHKLYNAGRESVLSNPLAKLLCDYAIQKRS